MTYQCQREYMTRRIFAHREQAPFSRINPSTGERLGVVRNLVCSFISDIRAISK